MIVEIGKQLLIEMLAFVRCIRTCCERRIDLGVDSMPKELGTIMTSSSLFHL